MAEYKCNICGELKDESLFKYENGVVQKSLCRKCLHNKHRSSLKLEMLTSLSSVCQCCGEDNPAFLCLDHINNDGHIEGLRFGQIVANAIKSGWDKTRYQVLCFNCNMAKANFSGMCPHKLGVNRELFINDVSKYIKLMGRKQGKFNTSNLAHARAVLKENRIARGEFGKDQATRSREYRERHPEYLERKKNQRRNKRVIEVMSKLTPEQLEQVRAALS